MLVNYKLSYEGSINAELILQEIRKLMGNLFNKTIRAIIAAFRVEVLVDHAGPIRNDVGGVCVVDEMAYVLVDKLFAQFIIGIESVREVVDVDGCHGLVGFLRGKRLGRLDCIRLWRFYQGSA